MAFRRRRPTRARVDEEAAGPPVVEEERYVPPRRPPFPEIWPWLLLFLLLVIGGLVAAYFLTRDNDKHKVTVPAVVGLRQDEAARRLTDRDLAPQATPKPSRFPAGTVFAQDPRAGKKVARHSRVAISVSAIGVSNVPDVVGSKASAAVARVKAAGLDAHVRTIRAQGAPGTVVSQSPSAGTSVAKGSTVALNVAASQTTVPDVTGQLAADAKAALRTAGLVPVEFKVPGTEPKGTVTAQKPLANKKVLRGSKVRINVSTGTGGGPTTTSAGTTTTAAPQTVTAPSILGIQQSAAQRKLHDAGLRALVKYVPSGRPVGVVLGQSPSAGTRVKKGSRVRLAVSRGPNPTLTVVPDVVGQDQQTATTNLQDAGFKVQVLRVASNPSQSGKVVDEQPAGGTRAPDGSTVTIYVGSG